MITLREVEEAIKELEKGPKNYETCRKLATFCTLRELMFGGGKYSRADGNDKIEVVGLYGESNFLRSVAGCDAPTVWKVMDELMAVLKMVNPRLYDGVMERLMK